MSDLPPVHPDKQTDALIAVTIATLAGLALLAGLLTAILT